MSRAGWNRNFASKFDNKIVYDDWLERNQKYLKKCKTAILDLGCGLGNDTLYLTENGFSVVACDYSDVAIRKIKQEFPMVKAKRIDFSKPLPFENESFDLIVADLSLHYFNDETTKLIFQELKRILTTKGYLLARVNSVNDVNHGAGQGKKIEENFYFVESYYKRFFNLNDVQKYFSIIGDVTAKETEMLRLSKVKKVFEVIAKKV